MMEIGQNRAACMGYQLNGRAKYCPMLGAECRVLGAYVRRSPSAMPEDRIQNEPYGVSESSTVSGSVLLLFFFIRHCCFAVLRCRIVVSG